MERDIYEIDESGKIVLLNTELPFNQRGFSKILFNGLEDEVPENYIDEPIPEGVRYPQWTGTEWIESLTQAEIDAINNVVKEPTEIELLRLEQAKANAEMIDLMMAMLGGM